MGFFFFWGDALRLAEIGNDQLLMHDTSIRSDKIFWLNRAPNNQYEFLFFDLIDAFVCYLNATCYAGIKSYEFHYALYEKGTFYKRHLDQFKSDDRRAFSMIMYYTLQRTFLEFFHSIITRPSGKSHVS